MFVLLFKNGVYNPKRISFDDYCMALVEMKDFDASIDNKTFFEQSVKNKLEAYEKLVEMSRNDYYATWNVLDYLYHQNYYKLVGINLSKQRNTTISLKVNFIEKLGKYNDVTMFFIAKNQQKPILNLDSLNVLE